MEAASPATEAERYVLSSWLERPDAVWESLSVMQVDDFAEVRHEILAEVIVELAREGKPTDPVAVTAALAAVGRDQQVGAAYVFELHGYATSSHNVAFYADIVHENGRRRAVMQAGDVLKGIASQTDISASDMLERARDVVDRAAGVDTNVLDVTSDEIIDDVLARIGKEEPAYHTPWPKLTRGIRGIRKGGLYVIGARPGIGKSAIALQLATSLEAYGFVGFFTLEMPQVEVTKRLISQQTGLAYAMIDGGRDLPDYATERIAQWREVYPGQMLIDDTPGRSIADIQSKVRTWARKYPLSGIVIDYLQLMTGVGDVRGANRVDIVGELSRRAKLIAREFDIPVILLSQLNRNPEQRADKIPALSDLRESGSIEQDADVVILLHRDMSLSSDPHDPQFIDLIIAKSRQSGTGKIELAWEGEFMRATGGAL